MDTQYYGKARLEMVRFVPEGAERLLDVGCAEGLFGAAVKAKNPNCEVWGVEPVSEAATAAKVNLDLIFCSQLEGADLPDDHFDAVTMNDSLEHMAWPENGLAVARRVLKPGRHLIVSIPNVTYCMNVKEMIWNNDWRYRQDGILDNTHLRFFTSKSATRFLQESGFVVEKVEGINQPGLPLKHRIAVAPLRFLFSHMRHYQYAIVARKAA